MNVNNWNEIESFWSRSSTGRLNLKIALGEVKEVKAAFVRGRNRVCIEDVDTPKVGEHEVLVRMKSCGLCGSDLEKVYGNYMMVSTRLGHEPTGIVTESGQLVQGFKTGDRVFIHHHVSCNACHYCWHGDFTMCELYQTTNIEPCGLSEQILVPETNTIKGGLVKLPDNLTFNQASLIEPLACCIRGLSKCRIQKGDDVVVLGAGPAGVMLALIAKLSGAGKILMADINRFRLDYAEKHFGVDILYASGGSDLVKGIEDYTHHRGADLTMVATGNARALVQSLDVTRKGGDILVFGIPAKETMIPWDMGKAYSKELSIVPSYASSEIEINQAIRILSLRLIELELLITHRFDLEYIAEAIECAHNAKDAMKVLVTSS
jgi:L-iditol 2-dehydrogenase